MKHQWTDWEKRKNKKVSPYQDWRQFRGASIGDATADAAVADCHDFDTLVGSYFENGKLPNKLKGLQASSLCPVIPEYAHNASCDGTDWLPNAACDEDLSPDTVVACVIDRAIALGHRRLRKSNGDTRVLGAWQQIASRDGVTDGLPFGRQLFASEINDALESNVLNGAVSKGVEEDAFNRAMGTDDFINLRGHRELNRIVAHGAHITDAVAGCDPADPMQATFRDNVRLMTVNLPDRLVIGLGSENLTYFVSLGILWSLSVADQIWTQKFGTVHSSGAKGFPFVINLSFAKQAGPRDGSDDISRLVAVVNKKRAKHGWRPIRLVVPTGNQNQQRGHAAGTIPAGQSVVLPWRIVPEDQSSNFMEIWPDAPDTNLSDIALRITSPAGESSTLSAGKPGQVQTLNTVARVYCNKVKTGAKTKQARYVLCVAPTSTQEPSVTVARSGLWMVEVMNSCSDAVAIRMDVQTDQSEQPESRAAQISYLDSSTYDRFDDTGRQKGSFPYPYAHRPGDIPNLTVRRDGTMNALGALVSENTVMVSGYRAMDGAPAPYSGTSKQGATPSVAYPSDISAAHLGVLSAGARDSSRVTMQGTSFATAQASRQVLEWLIVDPNLQDLPAAFAQLALAAEGDNVSRWSDAAREQTGTGRAALRDGGNLGRVEWPDQPEPVVA